MRDEERLAVHRTFEQRVELTPNQTALIVPRVGGVTYRELNSRANALARRLIREGVTAGTAVGVCMPRSVGWVVAALAILKAHGIYLPLDTAYPQRRLSFMVRDAAARLVVTDAARSVSPLDGCQTISLDDARPADAFDSHTNVALPGVPPEVAYIVYTSGSTGQPKGVEGTHRSLLNRLQWAWNAFPYEAGEISCAKTAVGFVDSLAELFAPLLGGSPVVIADELAARDPALLCRTLTEYQVSRLVAVPSLIVSLCTVSKTSGYALSNLKFLISSGEPLTNTLAAEVYRTFPSVTLLNLYGSSEVGADVTCYQVPHSVGGPGLVPIGTPIANTVLAVAGEDGKPVTDGDVGELYVGGEGLARGYRNRVAQTAARFGVVTTLDPSTPMFRSGDLVRRLPDGNLAYCGRRDRQVKIRGVRIELDEIERVLGEAAPVSAASVVVREYGDVDQLVAYIVTNASEPERDDAAATATTRRYLRSFLLDRLPEVMVPAHMVFLDRLPLTANGKIDRIALPPPDDNTLAGSSYAPPSSELERALAAVWAKVLGIGVNRIGVDDEFGALGGHSLAMLDLLLRLPEVTGVTIPRESINARATIASMAAAVQREKSQRLPRRTAQRGRKGECQLSPPQLRILGAFTADSRQIRQHNMEFLWRVDAPVERVTAALDDILRRHDVFRIDEVRCERNGRWVQRFAPSVVSQVVRVSDDCSNLREFVKRAVRFRGTINPSLGQMYRLATYAETTDRTYIYGLVNHLIFDGYSLQVIRGELSTYLHMRTLESLPTSVSFLERTRHLSGGESHRQAEEEGRYWDAIVSSDAQNDAFAQRRSARYRGELKTTRCTVKLGQLRPRRRANLILAACVHSVAEQYSLKRIHARVVGSGRLVSPEIDDAMTVGYLSDHYPQVFEAGPDVVATLLDVCERQRALPRGGMGYGWLRHVFRRDQLVRGRQIHDFPLHYNYLPLRVPPDSLIADETRRLSAPPPFQGDHDYAGIAFLVSDLEDRVEIGLYRSSRYISDYTVRAVLRRASNHLDALARYDEAAAASTVR